MSDLVWIIISGAVLGLLYSTFARLRQRAKSRERNPDFYWSVIFLILIIFIVGTWGFLQNSIAHGLIFLISGLVVAFISAGITVKRPSSTSNATANPDVYASYASTIIKISISTASDLAEPLHLSNNQKHKLINETFGFSIFMTTMQLQARKVPNAKIDIVIDKISDSLALQMSEIADTTHTEALNQIIQSSQHFYGKHRPSKSSDGGDVLQKIATSYLKEYRPKDYEDFFALKEITLTLGNIGKALNETGFSKKI